MCPSVSLYVSLFRAIFVSLGLSLPCPMSLSLFLSSLLSCPSLPISLSPSLFLPLYDTLKKMLPSNTAHEKLTRKKKRRHWTNQIKHATHEHCSRVSVDFFFSHSIFSVVFFLPVPCFFLCRLLALSRTRTRTVCVAAQGLLHIFSISSLYILLT